MSTPSRDDNAPPVERLLRPLRAFAELEAAGGILLIACTVIALVWANSPWAASYAYLWHIHLTFGFGRAQLSEELHFWVNDGLMSVFFLFVGLEIKREALTGELASMQKAALPLAAAVGGMLLPAGFYALFNHGGPGAVGWGVPMATDIAFALGVLALLGDRVPAALKVFLAALAIADDIGAVLVIAFFYTAQISWLSLGAAAFLLGVLILMNRIGVRHPAVYAVLGFVLWLALLKSGIHATIAGVLLALTVPARQRLDGRAFLERSKAVLDEFRAAEAAGDTIAATAAKSHALQELASDCSRAEAPMLRIEHALAPWIKYVIMPVFALANAGVALGGGALGAIAEPVSIGILCGLVLGKPIGIVAFTWFGSRTGIGRMPTGVGWRQIIGAGMLAGIGFTMSLFVANLAFGPVPEIDAAKVAILAASLVSGIAGAVVLLGGKSRRR